MSRRQYYTSDNSSDLETSPSDIIEIEESPIKLKKKKTFSKDSKDNTSRSSTPKYNVRGKINTTGDLSVNNSVSSEKSGKFNKSRTSTSEERGNKRKTPSSKRDGQKQTRPDDSDTSSDEEFTRKRACPSKRVRRGLAKRLYGNSQETEVLPSGSGRASQDGWYSTTKASQPSTSHANSQVSTRESQKSMRQVSTREAHKSTGQVSTRESQNFTIQVSKREPRKITGQVSTRESQKSTGQISTKEPRKSTGQISTRQTHTRPVSASKTFSFTKTSSDSDVVVETVKTPQKKCIFYPDSDPTSEGFDPSISDEAMGHLSSDDSSSDLFVTQTTSGQKSQPKKTSSSDESTVDSDATIIDSPVQKEAHTTDSDATIIDSPVHSELPDTQLPDLTLKFMSSSEDEAERICTSRKKSNPSERPQHHKGKEGVNQGSHRTLSHTNNDSQGPHTGDSQESESLFGKPPSMSQHLPDDDPYKFPSQSQDRIQSMPSLKRISSTYRSGSLGMEVKPEVITDQENTTDSDVDVPLANLSLNKYKTKSTDRSSVKRTRDNSVDDGTSEFNPWPQSNKRVRRGSYSQSKSREGNETQNYSLRDETINHSKEPDIVSEVENREKSNVLIPKTEPLSYGYTQDLTVLYVEDSDSDFEDMSQKIIEISSDEDEKRQDFDIVDEYKAYFNLPDSDDDDLQMFGQGRDKEVPSSSPATSNIDWVSVDDDDDDDDDFSYGLLTQPAGLNKSVYDQPTQIDAAETEYKVSFTEEVVNLDEIDDEDADPYEVATQVDEEEEEENVDMSVYHTDTQVDHVAIRKHDEDSKEHTKGKGFKQHEKYSTHAKEAGHRDGEEPSEDDGVYSIDTQVDDVQSHHHDEEGSIYSADTQLDDDYQPEVYIDVDDKEEVYVKVEPMDTVDLHKQVTEIDPFDLCDPVDRHPKVNFKPKRNNVRIMTDDDAYAAQTQVDGAGIIDEEDNIYAAQTQIDGTGVIGEEDEDYDKYAVQTQVDGAGILHDTDDEDNIYGAQTQVDEACMMGDADDEDDVYTAQTQVDGVSIIIDGDDYDDDDENEDNDIYAAQTQVDGIGKVSDGDDENDDIYAAQTQVDGTGLIDDVDEDDDVYTAQTQVDGTGLIDDVDDEDDDVYTAQTQVDGAGIVTDGDDDDENDIYTAQTQVDGVGIINDGDDENDDIYAAQTQVDDAGIISDEDDDDDDDVYNAQTQVDDFSLFTSTDDKGEGVSDTHAYVDRNKVKGHRSRLSKGDDNNMDQRQAKVKLKMSKNNAVIKTTSLHQRESPTEAETSADNEVEDPYLAATQIDGGVVDLSSGSDDDLYMANTQIDSLKISTGAGEDTDKNVTETETGDVTISSTEGGANNFMDVEDEEDTEPYNVSKYNLSAEGSLTPSDKGLEKEKSLVKSIDKMKFQNLFSVKKTVLPTEPQRLKTTAEKSESFRIEKSTFYSKKSVDVPVQTSGNKKPSAGTSGWLSTSRSVNSRTLPKMKSSKSKRRKVEVDNSQQIKDRMSVARAQMLNRQQNSVKPTAHRNMSLTAATGYNTDVQLPNYEEICAKQLPLLSVVVPSSKHFEDSSLPSRQPHEEMMEKGTPVSGISSSDSGEHPLSVSKDITSRENGKVEIQESGSRNHENRHRDRSSSTGSGSRKNDSRDKERSQSSGSESEKHESGLTERSLSTESGSSKNDSGDRERSQSTISSKSDSRDKERSKSLGSRKLDSRNKERSPSTESGSRKHDSRDKERLESTGSGSRKHDPMDKERSKSTNSGSSKSDSRHNERSKSSGSRKHDCRNKERSPSTESGSRKHDSRDKDRLESTRSGKHDGRHKEMSQSTESRSSKNDSRHNDRSKSSGSEARKHESGHKERSQRTESGSRKHDSKDKERSPSTESCSGKHDSRGKERSWSTGSGKHDGRDKESSPSTESGSNKHDSRRNERSKSTESGSGKYDRKHKEKLQSAGPGSSKNDSRNNERSRSSGSGANKHDSRGKERSPSTESGSGKHDNRHKEGSPSTESGSNKHDNRDRKRSRSTEPGSEKHDGRRKDNSQSTESGSRKHESRDKERSQSTESESRRNDSGHKERSSSTESYSGNHDSRPKEKLLNTEDCKGDQAEPEIALSLESISEEEIMFNEDDIPDLNSNKKADDTCIFDALSEMTGTKENRPPRTSATISSTGYNVDSVNKSTKHVTTPGDLPTLSQPRVGKMIRRQATGPKSILSHPEKRISKPGRRVGFNLPDKETHEGPVISKQVRSILAREGRLPEIYQLPKPGKVTNPVGPLNKPNRTIPHGSSLKPAGAVQTSVSVPKGPPIAKGPAIPKGAAISTGLPVPRGAAIPKGPPVPRGAAILKGPSVPRGAAIPKGPSVPRGAALPNGPPVPRGAAIPKGPPVPRGAALPKAPVPPSRPHNLMEKRNTAVQNPINRPLTDITGASNSSQDKQYSLDNLLVKLLKWNPIWLQEQEKCPFPPPDIEKENPLFSLSESYSHFDDYVQLFTPHILMETWETTIGGYKKTLESGIILYRVHLSAVQTSSDKKFVHLTWNGVVQDEKYRAGDYLCEADLVIVHYVSEEPDPKQPGGPPLYIPRASFGFLERVSHHKAQDIPRLYDGLPLLREDARALGNKNVATLKLKLKIRNGRNLRLAPQPASLQRVVSLVSIVRQYNAMVGLRRNVLWRHILEPGRTDVFSEVQPVTETLRMQLSAYNPSQQRAICTAAKVATQPVNLPRICLLQGPPGTGKSHTIVGIVDKIIRDTQGRGRICLCTPSNAAVDEVLRRLIFHKKRATRDPNHLPYGLHVVRIGKTTSVHKDVAKHTFNEIVNGHIKNEIARKKEKNFPQSSQRELDSLTEKITVLSNQLEQVVSADPSGVQRKRLQADLQKLEQKKADLNYQHRNINKSISLTPAEEYEIKKNVLWRAHVICGTLNSFGSELIQNLLQNRHPTDQSSFSFNCIVMDEASQATELDCLIPLQYGTSKLIMVGDPEQLSPTVLSRKAEEKCFGQSMFERMYGYYKYKDSNPVILLDTQYRMNPEIAAFPSQYVYEGRLLSDRCVEERGQNFPLKPYLVFDIDEGQERSSQAGSIKNEAEAHFVTMLCHHIIRHTDIPQTDIGIIAPYQSQKSLIVGNLRQWKMTSIEVGTVDGFQGREKEVIIMSCVRASSSGGIGFVANRKRMNVALTRARSAMYVVGNLSSLERSGGDWKILIEDARNRHVIRRCGSQTNFFSVIQTCFKRTPT